MNRLGASWYRRTWREHLYFMPGLPRNALQLRIGPNENNLHRIAPECACQGFTRIFLLR